MGLIIGCIPFKSATLWLGGRSRITLARARVTGKLSKLGGRTHGNYAAYVTEIRPHGAAMQR